MAKSKELERITGDVSIKRYFDTDYIGAYSLDDGAEPILTIDSLWYGELTLGGGRKENHVVIKFREQRVPGVDEVKPLILNATNRKALKKLFGDDSAATLEGKQIQLYIDPKVRDPQDGGYTEGLRIRPFRPKIKSDTPIKCESCGTALAGFGKMNPAQLAEYTRQSYGKVLCAECAGQVKAARDAAAVVIVEVGGEFEHYICPGCKNILSQRRIGSKEILWNPTYCPDYGQKLVQRCPGAEEPSHV